MMNCQGIRTGSSEEGMLELRRVSNIRKGRSGHQGGRWNLEQHRKQGSVSKPPEVQCNQSTAVPP